MNIKGLLCVDTLYRYMFWSVFSVSDDCNTVLGFSLPAQVWPVIEYGDTEKVECTVLCTPQIR